MTVLTIRACKRYATRQKVRLRSEREQAIEGLLIELSAEGCRISNLGCTTFDTGQSVTLAIGDDEYHGRIRWSREGIAGVRLDPALHYHEVAGLLEAGRNSVPALLYGT